MDCPEMFFSKWVPSIGILSFYWLFVMKNFNTYPKIASFSFELTLTFLLKITINEFTFYNNHLKFENYL